MQMKNFKKTKNRINIYLMNFTKDNIKKSFVNIILKKKQDSSISASFKILYFYEK